MLMTLPFHIRQLAPQIQKLYDLEKLQGWSEKWLTTFNSTKTKVFFISKSENGSDINLRFNNRRLEVSTVHMYLGIALSNDTK